MHLLLIALLQQPTPGAPVRLLRSGKSFISRDALLSFSLTQISTQCFFIERFVHDSFFLIGLAVRVALN